MIVLRSLLSGEFLEDRFVIERIQLRRSRLTVSVVPRNVQQRWTVECSWTLPSAIATVATS